jgi:hypothetical protein
MSFTIDDSKVDELLKSSKKTYEVSTSTIGLGTENYSPPYYAASGVTYTTPGLVTEESREHLMALRRKIEESGIPLKNAGDLGLEIREMRRGAY